MEKVKRMFVEFKSIFFSNNVLEENESHANVVVATTMLNLFLICAIAFLLVAFNVFKVGMFTITEVLLINVFLLFLPAIICLVTKSKKKSMRLFLFVCFILAMAANDCFLKYNVSLIIVLPVVLAARYYNKKFTIWVSVFTMIAFIVSTALSLRYGQQDINTYNLIIPSGTTITIDSTLREAVNKISVDETQRLKNIYIHFFIPKMFVYSIVFFACVQISQSGKKMLERQIEITTKTARLDTELDLAYNIQKSMLPSKFPAFPDHKEIDIYATSIPAKEVGGDFYDMFLLDDNHLAIIIADVSGKGVPASLFMMISQILIRVIANEGGDVNDVVSRVNKIMSKDNKLSLFVTAWFGVLNLKNGQMEYVNAGHNPPLVYSSNNGTFEYLKTKSNFVIAGLENANYEKSEITLYSGDKIFLYTDGVTEATKVSREMYGEKRLKSFLDKNIGLDCKETIVKLKEDIDIFVGKVGQSDDITMLELEYKGANSNSGFSSYEFNAELSELDRLQDLVNIELEKLNVGAKVINQVNLAVEEIFVNIVNYAYQDKNGKCFVSINASDKKLIIIFEDNGIPFNPLQKENPDVTLSSEDREIGGLGIFLTKKMVDDIHYEYKDNKNILTLTKIIEN